MAKVVTVAGPVVTGVPYGENVVAGDLVGWSSATLKRAVGAVGEVVAAVGVATASYQSGETGAMALLAEISGLSGLTIGAAVYLSLTTAGAVQAGVPSGAGNLKQTVGYAVAADRVAIVLQDAGAVI